MTYDYGKEPDLVDLMSGDDVPRGDCPECGNGEVEHAGKHRVCNECGYRWRHEEVNLFRGERKPKKGARRRGV